MDWPTIHIGFFDELSKIAEINLSGLSPETIMEKGQPPAPMETPGLAKAQAILDRAQTTKVAAKKTRVQGSAIGAPHYLALGKSPDGPEPTTLDKVKKVGINAIGGMGVGKLLTDYGHSLKNAKPSPRVMAAGMTAGGLLGLANYARTSHREREFKKSAGTFTSPAEQLKSTRQVGTVKNGPHKGPGIKAQIPLMGRKAVPGETP